MADYTVSLTEEEEKVLESFYTTAAIAVNKAVNRVLIANAREIIRESSSLYDPRKMTVPQLRTEISNVASEIPTYAERFPEM